MQLNKLSISLTILFTLILPLYANAAIPGCISEQYKLEDIEHDRIAINAPTIAEQGAVVSVGIDDVKNVPQGVHVKELSLFNEFRVKPVARFVMNEEVSAKSLKTRVRLRESSNIYAVAVLSNGEVVGGERFVKVTIGGCGGGGTSEIIAKAERVCNSDRKK
jgi:predicted secreted protein